MSRVRTSLLKFFLDGALRRLLHDPERILRPWVEPGMIVADIGCGPGFFTIPLARLVGPKGRVLALDTEPAYFDSVRKRAGEAGLGDRILTLASTPDTLGIRETLDFALAFWMMHEVPSRERLLGEIRGLLRPGARLLLAEPFVHVRKARFEETVAIAEKAGFQIVARPRIRGSYAVALQNPAR